MASSGCHPSCSYCRTKTTAVEIWEDTDGEVDTVISGVGTGGTVTGIGQALKKRKAGFKVIAVEPEDSPARTSELYRPLDEDLFR